MSVNIVPYVKRPNKTYVHSDLISRISTESSEGDIERRIWQWIVPEMEFSRIEY